MAVASHLALLLVWYLFVKFGDVPKFVMPSPVDTVKTLGVGELQLVGQRRSSRRPRSTAATSLALVVGVLLALAFTWSKPLEALMMPLLVSLNMIPKVALGPLIIVWFKYGIVPEHADRLLDLRLPDPAHDRARPARGRARPARPGAER